MADLSREIARRLMESGSQPSRDGEEFISTGASKKSLSNYIGKDNAKKVLAEEKPNWNFTGEELQIGGHGNKVYYDEMWVNQVNKRMKKYGMKVEREITPLYGMDEKMFDVMEAYVHKNEGMKEAVRAGYAKSYWKLKFTDKFKKEWAEKGQSLFSAAPIAGSLTAGSEEDGKATDITDLLMGSH